MNPQDHHQHLEAIAEKLLIHISSVIDESSVWSEYSDSLKNTLITDTVSLLTEAQREYETKWASNVTTVSLLTEAQREYETKWASNVTLVAELIAEKSKAITELTEAQKDKKRLDWLESAYHRPEWLMNLSQDARSVIDSAMESERKGK